jgi:hypothetical protein
MGKRNRTKEKQSKGFRQRRYEPLRQAVCKVASSFAVRSSKLVFVSHISMYIAKKEEAAPRSFRSAAYVAPRPNRALYIYIYRALFGRVLIDEVYRRLFF